MKLNQRGMSLVELLVSFAIASVASLGLYSAMNSMNKDKARVELLAILAEKKNSFSRLLDDPEAIRNTIAATENVNMQCLRDKVDCGPTYRASTYSSTQDRIVLYGRQQGLPFYDGRSTNIRGFTARGADCTGFSYDLNNGNDNCPIGYIVTWFAQNSGGTTGVTITITAKLVFNPSSNSPMKSYINAHADTPIRSYDAVVSRTVEAAADLTTASCSQDGITLYHTANYTFYSTTSVAPGERCQQEIRQCIITINVPLLSGTFAHSTCAQNCHGEWSACSAPCGGGTQTYTHLVEANQWGTACAIANGSTQSCNTAACPGPPTPPPPPTPPLPPPPPNIDCVGNWGACSAGSQTYFITTPASGSGVACPNSNGDTKACATPVDCSGAWGSCVSGFETYAITTPASNGGAACSAVDGATRSCSAGAVDCIGSWGSCSQTCGGGTQTFAISTPASNGGAACSATDGQSRACNTQTCPLNCAAPFIEGGAGQASPTTPGCACPNTGQVYNAATSTCEMPTPVNCQGAWGPCISGTETYTVITPASNGGTSCPVASGATRSCALPPVNCSGSWGPCISGTETYSVTTPAANGGNSCPVANGTTRTCGAPPPPPPPPPPPVNCVGSWGPCNKTCGGGLQTYTVTTPAANGGNACSATNGQTMSCNNQPCPPVCTAPFVQGGAGQASPTQPGCSCPQSGQIYNAQRNRCMESVCRVMTACTGSNARIGGTRSCAYSASAPGMCPYPTHYHAGRITGGGLGSTRTSYWNCYPCGPGSTSTVCYDNPACIGPNGDHIDGNTGANEF